jgi:hypothetical protein
MASNTSLTKLFQKFIPENIPKKQTSIFWMLFNGVDAVVAQFETVLKIFRKERNILTANQLSSLRSLAAYNGYEPQLKIPATGTVQLTATSKLFNRVGSPLYVPPYAQFTEEDTGLVYYYDGNKVLRIDNEPLLLTLTEGSPASLQQTSGGSFVERYYLPSQNIADGSIMVSVGTQQFLLVKSFFDSVNLNEGFLFQVKFSNRPDTPIVIYVVGTQLNDIVDITWKTTIGEQGNLLAGSNFTTTDLLTAQGLEVNPASDEMAVGVVNGFNLGSNGTDENSLRAAIGFNHGVTLLFDTVSYTAFIDKFSTLLLQKVVPSSNSKQISNIYLSLKTYLNPEANISLQDQYQQAIGLGSWLVPADQKALLDGLIAENEFALSSHNLFNPITNNYAVQVLFEDEDTKLANIDGVNNLVYTAFSQFLYNSSASVNFEILFDSYMTEKGIKFEWSIFSQSVEAEKIATQVAGPESPYVLSARDGILPILRGNFPIADQNFAPIRLFFDLNIVSQGQIAQPK